MLKPPALLTRSQAMNMTGFGRKVIEKMADQGKVRTYRTKGNHRRYHRDDFTKHLSTNEERQS
jgi:excisionase family DNA binding protein